MTYKVLLVFSNPRDRSAINFGLEDKIIQNALRYSNISFERCHAANFDDLRRALLQYQLRVVQLSGHSIEEGYVFEDDKGYSSLVPPDLLLSLLGSYSPPLECVILNSCQSISIARALASRIPYVVATQSDISDASSIQFSKGFYEALAHGKSIEFAFDEGCRCVQAHSPTQYSLPSLISQKMTYPQQFRTFSTGGYNYQRLYNELTAGNLEIDLDTSAISELTIIKSLIDKVFQEEFRFSNDIIYRFTTCLGELVSNVRKHTSSSFCKINIRVNKEYYSVITLSVSDSGQGFSIISEINKQLNKLRFGEKVHGLLLMNIIADGLISYKSLQRASLFTIQIQIVEYQIPKSSFDWCGFLEDPIDSPISKLGEEYKSAFNVSVEREAECGLDLIDIVEFCFKYKIYDLAHIIFGKLLIKKYDYVIYEVSGGPTTVLPRTSPLTRLVLENIFVRQLEQKRVFVFANCHSAGYDYCIRFAKKYNLEIYFEEQKLLERLRSIDRSLKR